MLRFESSKAKHFFWMQDKSHERDTWLTERLNTLINDPDAPATEAPNGEANPVAGVLSGLGGGGMASAFRQQDSEGVSEELINDTLATFPGGAEAFWDGMQGTGVGREELLQMLASEMEQPLSIPQTPSASQQNPLFPFPSQGSQVPASQQPTQPSSELPANLQSQLASITAGLPGGANGGQRREYMSLNDVLTRDVLTRVLQMDGIGERLRPGMPENWDADSGVDEVVQSPQFQQALSSLSSAISTGQLAPLLQQFGLEGGIDNVESFLRAVEAQVRREQGGRSDGTGRQEEDDRMQED